LILISNQIRGDSVESLGYVKRGREWALSETWVE